MQLWREALDPIPDALELTFSSSLFSPGAPIEIQLSGTEVGDLQQAATELKNALAGYPGVYDVADSFRPGKKEIRFEMLPAAESLGLTLSDVARQVRQAFYGEEAQRVQRGRYDVRVMVRYPARQRRNLGDLDRMRIRTSDGVGVPLAHVARTTVGRGYATIRRVDRARVISVTANVDDARGNAEEILAGVRGGELPEILSRHPGVRYTLEGQQREQRDTISGLTRGFIIALVAIYGLMAIPFRSYIQPVVVMTAIPFGLVGAVWGHVVMGMNLTILSAFGAVALTGVVVNDSLVMVDYVNRRRREGLSLHQAVRTAGVARFRPILLTSLTTFAGLTPLLLEKSMQAQFLIPMAISLGFGVIFATFVTLILVPATYLILEDIRAGLGFPSSADYGEQHLSG
ncbi:MAG: efflux RND transporter permease subunit [Acidobacteriota bacterium]|nr:efflux RND transporter permease subunit [Acidobacteriota bacterium]